MSMLKISDLQFSQAVCHLEKLVSIPSISNTENADYNISHLFQAAEYITNELKKLDFYVITPCIDGSAPFIIAERISDKAYPTLLLYSHYDVQPVERSKWDSDPFKLLNKDSRLYGRGASDDKAGIVSILAAIHVYKEANKKLPVNIKILFEGEEEYGSVHMDDLLKEHASKLHAHAMIILDCLNIDVNTGTLTSSTRGCVNLNVQVKAYEKPIHSGVGCIAPDPVQVLACLISSLTNPRAIPGFTDGFEEMKEEERKVLANSSQTPESYVQDVKLLTGSQDLRGSPSKSIYERIVEEPSISIVNMNAGKPNGGNSIQDVATCEINIRVLPGQDPDKIAQTVKKHLENQVLPYKLPVEITQPEAGCWAWKGDLSLPFAKKYFESLSENFSKIGAMPTGGTLPLLRQFQSVFSNMEMICVGVEDPHTSAHSHNESQHIGIFRNAINSLIAFFEKSGSLKI